MHRLIATLIAGALLLSPLAPALAQSTIHYFYALALRASDLLACDRELQEAGTVWPGRYGGIPRQGLSVVHDATALRAEAQDLQRRFRAAAAPLLRQLAAGEPRDKKRVEDPDGLRQGSFASTVERLAAICWTLELRRARLELDRVRHAYLSTPELVSYREKESEIYRRTIDDPAQYKLEMDALVAATRPHEIAARSLAVADYGELTARLLERRRVLAGSLKAMIRNLHEVAFGLGGALAPADALRAGNYRLFAVGLAKLPPEEVVRIFGHGQNRALLVSMLDAFHLLPGPQDLLQLPAFAVTVADESLKMDAAFAAAPFAQIPPYNYRPILAGRPTLLIEAGPVTITAAGAPR